MSARVLILTASAGSGHNMAARALFEEAERLGVEARLEDLMDHVRPRFRRWFQGGYERLVRESPKLWGHLYRASDRRLLTYQVQTLLDVWNCRVLAPMLDEFAPDWVICTHSLPQPTLAILQRRRKFRTAVVVTDLHPHRMWLRGAPDRYFVPTESSRLCLARRFPLSDGRTLVAGIPVNRAFAETRRKRVPGLALVAAGGIGAGPLADAVEAALSVGWRCEVVTGGNECVRKQLFGRFEGNPSVEILGYMTPAEMAERLATCAALVSKSGGLTTFECLVSACPLIVYKPLLIPGQEEDNAAWIQQEGAGVIAANATELSNLLECYRRHPEALDAIKETSFRLGRPNAAEEILRSLGLVRRPPAAPVKPRKPVRA